MRRRLEEGPRRGERAFSQDELACLKVGPDFFDALLMFLLYDYVSIGTEALENFELLIWVSAADLRRQDVIILLVFKHEELKFICTDAGVPHYLFLAHHRLRYRGNQSV